MKLIVVLVVLVVLGLSNLIALIVVCWYLISYLENQNNLILELNRLYYQEELKKFNEINEKILNIPKEMVVKNVLKLP